QRPSTNRFLSKPVPGAPPASSNRRNNRPVVAPRKGPMPDDEFEEFRTVSVRERWGLDYKYDELVKDENDVYQPVPAVNMASAAMPERIACHTALYFEN